MPGPLSSKPGPSNTRAYLSDLIDSYHAAITMKKADDAARIELKIQGYLKDQPSHQYVYNELVKAKEIISAEPMLRALATSESVQYYNPGFAAAGAAAGGKRRGQKTRKHSKKGKKTKKSTRSQRR